MGRRKHRRRRQTNPSGAASKPLRFVRQTEKLQQRGGGGAGAARDSRYEDADTVGSLHTSVGRDVGGTQAGRCCGDRKVMSR